MTEEIDQLLKNLHLRHIAEILPDQLGRAALEQPTYQDFLLRLLRPQWHAKNDQALEWRIHRAKLPERWTLEGFPFERQPGISRRQIKTLAELDFIAKAENIVLIGPTGVGKTGLACGILLKALKNGYRCQFVRAQDLFDDMYASLADNSSRKLIDRLARLDLLLIDEMGYLNLRPEQSNIFFKLMEERYTRRATLITTNLDYEEWKEFLGNRPMVDALLSRLRHRCHTLKIEGPSLRAPQGMKGHAAWWDFDPATDRNDYVRRLLGAYARTPTCAGRVRREDHRLAHRLHERRIPLRLVEASFSLAAMRRIYRPFESAPLPPVRSLHYFLPIIDEIRRGDIDPEYIAYAEWKVRNADRELEQARQILARCEPSPPSP